MSVKQIFRKILIPTDGSHSSLVGQELAAQIAKSFSSTVTILHVTPTRSLSTSTEGEGTQYIGTGLAGPVIAGVPAPREIPVPKDAYSGINDWFQKTGENIISDAMELFKEQGIEADSKLVEYADPAEAIIQQSHQGKYDLIVLGYGGEELQTPHLGSVTKKVSQHAKASVLIARDRNQISKIIVPVDGSKNATKALLHASTLATKLKAKITLLYVQESSLVRLRPEIAKQIGTHVLTEAASQVKGLEIEQQLKSGDPAKTIIEAAAEGNHDLIVLGRKGHSAVRHFLLGSVSDHVIHYVDRSVLLIR